MLTSKHTGDQSMVFKSSRFIPPASEASIGAYFPRLNTKRNLLKPITFCKNFLFENLC